MKKLLTVFFVVLSIIHLSAFAWEKRFRRGIIFNNVPFTKETAESYTRTFQRGERIYWLFMSKKPIDAQFIGVQVVSATHKGNGATISGIVYTHDYRINRDNPYYFTDYFVIHSPGHYYMQIFDKNYLVNPLVVADFFVK